MLHVTVVLKVGVTLGLTLGRAQDTKTDQEERAQSETKSRPHRTGEGSKNPAVLGDEEWETGLPSRASLAAAGGPGRCWRLPAVLCGAFTLSSTAFGIP